MVLIDDRFPPLVIRHLPFVNLLQNRPIFFERKLRTSERLMDRADNEISH